MILLEDRPVVPHVRVSGSGCFPDIRGMMRKISPPPYQHWYSNFSLWRTSCGPSRITACLIFYLNHAKDHSFQYTSQQFFLSFFFGFFSPFWRILIQTIESFRKLFHFWGKQTSSYKFIYCKEIINLQVFSFLNYW